MSNKQQGTLVNHLRHLACEIERRGAVPESIEISGTNQIVDLKPIRDKKGRLWANSRPGPNTILTISWDYADVFPDGEGPDDESRRNL